ncbi:MAG: hypothetical protein HOP11_03875 [Saprospiraceae bacterium]|nr:hypothetical protein [Saprospiraceae bacterium]
MNQAKDDIQLIRQMMERSSSFLSLSGLSGVAAGICALIASGTCWYLMKENNIDYFEGKRNIYPNDLTKILVLIAILTVIAALFSGFIFTYRKSKRMQLPLWTSTTKSLLIHLSIPLVTGGLFCLLLIYHQLFFLVAPCTLLFYGLALTSASKFMHKDIFGLGIFEILLALFAIIIPGYGLIVWAVGFGLMHIIYGTIMHFKYQ